MNSSKLPKKKKRESSPKKTNSKSRSKSKSKEKKFNAREYLEALMDLQNTNYSTNRKKKCTKRDISSALTIATPALEKTTSASKIRSRSSLSNYRKKFSSTARGPINLNLEAVITEEENVQYTEKTARSNYAEKENDPPVPKMKIFQLNKNICAIKIQRAWRNYQTYKMIHKIYLQQNKKARPASNKLHIGVRKSDLERTLKVKRQTDTRDQKEKMIMQRFRQENDQKTLKSSPRSPIYGMIDCNEISCESQLRSSQMLLEMKEREAERFQQVIEMIQKEKQKKPKEELLNDLIHKFEENKKKLEQDIGIQMQSSEFKSFSPAGSENQRSVGSISLKDYLSSESSQYDGESLLGPEGKIFKQRITMLESQKFKQLEKIDEDVDRGMLTKISGQKKKDLVYNRYDRQKKKVEKNKKQYLFSLTQLKSNAIICHKNKVANTSSQSRIRKSFSVGNTIIKSVLEEIKNLQILSSDSSHESLLYVRETPEKNDNELYLEVHQASSELLTPERPISEQVQKNNTEAMKSYSEDIQELIEKILIEEFTNEAYLDENLYRYFKPYVEEIYEFEKISDVDIVNFFTKLEPFMPARSKMLVRVNQKINPTSREILRIIRDLQYQIEQYELIIPEQCFKSYRQSLEKQYESRHNQRTFLTKNTEHIKDYRLVQKVYERESQKMEKVKKYSNFQRDLKIMYMKSAFNCINELLIETKSSNSFMNARSSIGPGQLTLALKQYNETYTAPQYLQLVDQVNTKLKAIIQNKCLIPSMKNYNDLELFQRQVMKQISIEYVENEFKWVNYMDEVLEIWEDLSRAVIRDLFLEAANDIAQLF